MTAEPESARRREDWHFAQLSDEDLAEASTRMLTVALLETCDRWAALAGCWQALPFVFTGGGWLLALSFASSLPSHVAYAAGYVLSIGGLAVGSWRLWMIRKLPRDAERILGLIRREMARRRKAQDHRGECA